MGNGNADSVESVSNVYLDEAHRAEASVGMVDAVEDSIQSATKLHRSGRSNGSNSAEIYAGEGKIHNDPRAAIALGYDTHG